jgi:hypothetical protein
MFVLFLEVVTLTFVLQTSISIGFLLSPSGICVPRKQKFDTFFVSAQYLKYKKLSTHMPHAERNKSHELEVCGSKVKITIAI